jgi:hypothetical protein
MVKRIDNEARIERIRLEDQATVFAGDPDSGYSWFYTTTGSSPHGGLYLEKSDGSLIGPFITGVAAEINTIVIYEDEVFQVTGTAIDFTDNMNVVVSGTVAFVSSEGGGATDVLLVQVFS